MCGLLKLRLPKRRGKTEEKIKKHPSSPSPSSSPRPASLESNSLQIAHDRPGESALPLVHPTSSDPIPEDTSALPASNEPRNLWDCAEETLINDKDKGKVMQAYLQIMESKLGSTLEERGTSTRQEQMSSLLTMKVQELKENRWKIHLGNHEVEVVTLFTGIINNVLLAKDIISTAASPDPHIALACAGVSVILSLLVKPIEQFNALLSGLDHISRLICQCNVIEQVYRRRAGIPRLVEDAAQFKKEFEDSLTRLYSQILEYQARALCHVSKHYVIQFMKDMVQASDWDTLLAQIKESESNCRGFTQLVDSVELYSGFEKQGSQLQEILMALKTDREWQEASRKIEKGSAFLQAVYTSLYKDHKDRNHDRVKGTCEWFMGHERFQHWKESKTSSLLWVSADPGCGKSVLAKYLVDEVLRSTDSRTTCYFFFKDDFSDQRKAVNALCAILRQLFMQRTELLRDEVLRKFEMDGMKLTESFRDLWNLLISAAADPKAGEIICILDALDECNDDERSQLTEALDGFYRTGNSKTQLKFLVTSRPYVHIQREFQPLKNHLPTIHLSGEDEVETEKISREIDLVIKWRAKDIGAKLELEHEEVSFLQDEISAVPHRTYLWLTLVFDVIENSPGYTKGSVRKTIRTIPKTVDEAYEKILNRSQDSKQAAKLLHIVVAASRPMTLTEMSVALAIKSNHRAYEDLDLEPEGRFRTTVRNLCGLFVTIMDSKIYLLHQTAKEFLVQREMSSWIVRDDASSLRQADEEPLTLKQIAEPVGLNKHQPPWKHSLDLTESNRVLAERCIWYLLFTVFENHPLAIGEEDDVKDTEEKVKQYTSEHIFLDYSAKNWAIHFREARVRTETAMVKLASEVCRSQSKRFLTWFATYWTITEIPFPWGITEITIGSYFGHEAVVKLLLEKDVDLESKDKEYGRTPLSWAAENGHEAVVKLLLEKGADLESKDKVYGRTPLSLAAENGHEVVAKLLLDKGADLESKDQNFRQSPLSLAAGNGYEAVAKLLLDKGADLESKDQNLGQTPLSWTARSGREIVAKLLLDKGADLESKDEYGLTPLSWAAEKGYEAVVKLLLEKGADLESKDEYGLTPLSWAAKHGYEAVEKLLLEKGAKIL